MYIQPTLSQEGISDVFAKLGKWFRRTFSTTGSRVERATLRRDELLGMIEALGTPHAMDYVKLVSGGMVANKVALDAISRTVLKKPVLVATHTTSLYTIYGNLCKSSRSRDNLATVPIMLDFFTNGKFYNKVTKICQFFLDKHHLAPYLEIAILVRKILGHRNEGNVILAEIEIRNLKKKINNLPYLNLSLHPDMGQWYAPLPHNDYRLSPAALEMHALSGDYMRCLGVFDHIHDSGVYESIEEILDCWKVNRNKIEGDGIGNVAIEIYNDVLDSQMRELSTRCLTPIYDTYNAIQLLLDAGYNGRVLHRLYVEAQQDYLEAVYGQLKAIPAALPIASESHEFTDLPVNLMSE